MTIITIQLTQLEANALKLILIDRIREKKDPDEVWEDVVSSEKVTLGELIYILTRE